MEVSSYISCDHQTIGIQFTSGNIPTHPRPQLSHTASAALPVSPNWIYTSSFKMKTYTSPERKLKKVMVEKRRRTRIDRALLQMKNMVLEALHVQPEKYAKMEKADILDLTVRFLRRVRQERQATVAGQDPRHMYPAAAMYAGHQAAAAAAAVAAAAYPFKMAPVRPIPTNLAGHPYAVPRGPYRPQTHAFAPLKSDSMPTPRSLVPRDLTTLPNSSRDHPRRIPTATVTSSSPEPSSTSRGDSPVPVTSSRPTGSPPATVTSSSEFRDNNNNTSSPKPGPSTNSEATPSKPGPGQPQIEARRQQIEAPIPLRMMVQDFPFFGPSVWRPWFS